MTDVWEKLERITDGSQGGIMESRVIRFSSGTESSLGLWYTGSDFTCFTLEDQRQRGPKIPGETRIPAGRYQLKQWTHPASKFNRRAAELFPDIHRGFVVEVSGVPNFSAVLVHWGSFSKDTRGCLLVGDTVRQNVTKAGMLQGSRDGYRRWYPLVAAALETGEECWLTIIDGES